MTELLQHVSVDRLLLVIFVGGQLVERFRQSERSRRDQGKRIGALETRIAALEASRGRA